MSQPFVGEIRLVGFNFQVNGWNFCNGAAIAISQNPTLFNLIGTTYGGDGQETFQLPDLQGRVPVHQGSGFVIGQKAGVESVTLTTLQYPQHSHVFRGTSNAGVSNNANSAFLGSGQPVYTGGGVGVTLNAAASGGSGGGNQPHDNMQPYLVINFIISLFGVFPSQN